ncbi:MAG TPA: cation-translocating P-type ATPase [Myxococcota bacterium]|nr:cation-translocating P-type ATPase [Myxococcota bacterium]
MSATTGLFLDGLRCAGCVHRVERSLREQEGVLDATVDYTTHRALVRFDDARTDRESLVRCVSSLGYAATPFDPESLGGVERRQARSMLARLLVAAFLAGNVMLISAALYIGSYQDLDALTRRALRWVAIALSVPAATWCAAPFWRGAFAGLARREITMDVPVVLGVSIALGASIAATWAEAPHVFMDSAAMIVFLILLGRSLERSASARAAGAVERLAALAPQRALRRRGDALDSVPVETLVPGDLVVVPPGERIPTDGEIVRGASELDESMWTGESRPVPRGPGDAVAAGVHNELAELELRVLARAREGSLARLTALLARAQAERPRIQRHADRVAAVFAPAVLCAAGATAIGWTWAGAPALETALVAASVLIVACPCALGLATPAAVAAAIGRAARLGVLVARGDALERCARVDSVLLDKTGTLTEGRLALEAIAAAPGVEEHVVLEAAAATEGASTHPLAEAIRVAARERGLAVRELARRETLAGRGIEAGEPSTPIRVGVARWLAECGVAIPPELAEAADKLSERGLSLCYVAEGPRALGVLALSDPPREDAPDAVAALRRLGLDVALASGDAEPAVRLASKRAGIEGWSAGFGPEQKVGWIRGRRALGRRVLAVGDGLNDAAALGAADVGAAMARGSDVTLAAADLVVRSPRLCALANAVALSRVALRRIHQNLGFALAYNALAIPLAAAGWLHPLPAALAMSLSSLLVVGNAVRLLRWKAVA